MIRRLQETDSTNNQARAWAADGAAEWSVVWAEWQSAGRGRFGNRWESAPGQNLLFSFILRPPRSAQLSQLTPLVGLACLRALRELGAPVQLKWPNDLWANGRKLGGILLEQAGEAVIAGVGINVHQRSFETPHAISLAQLLQREVDREALLEAILEQARRLYAVWLDDGFEPIRRQWEENACFMGESVEAGGLRGRQAGMDGEGALLLETAQGLRRIHSGELRGLRLS